MKPLHNESEYIKNEIIKELNSKPADYRKSLYLKIFISDYRPLIQTLIKEVQEPYRKAGIILNADRYLLETLIGELFFMSAYSKRFRYVTYR